MRILSSDFLSAWLLTCGYRLEPPAFRHAVNTFLYACMRLLPHTVGKLGFLALLSDVKAWYVKALLRLGCLQIRLFFGGTFCPVGRPALRLSARRSSCLPAHYYQRLG